MLLQGPDRNKTLRGVLLRFRRHPYAVMADIENMFHQLAVPDEQNNHMRFFWYRDNDPNKEIIEYWSKVHLMGNTSSPAIANLGVRYAARKDPPVNGRQWLVEDDLLDPYQLNQTRIPDNYENTLAQQFYVDDFLASAPTPEAALRLIDEGISRFKRYDLKLCKVQSNSGVIRKAYPSKDKMKTKVDLAPCDPLTSEPANGKSLGLQWDIERDEFSIKTEFKDRPYTKRGLLGYIMSPYDPMGLA